MVVRYSVAAERELANAAEFYNQERDGLGDVFLHEVQRVASFLIDHPRMGQAMRENRRVLLLNRFPYRLIDDIKNNGIRIIAVAHQSRRPDYWWGCVEEPHPRYVLLPAAA